MLGFLINTIVLFCPFIYPPHTGTYVRHADSIVVTTFPADVVQDLQDFILWQPDATETGVEAL
ncbi:TPA: S-type pyocin domain-containing protein [Serratia liquefaciens]